MYNPGLYVGSMFLARPDVWWRNAGVAAEVDSREWHYSPDQWAKTMARHSRMTAHGIFVLHFTPQQVKAEPRRVVAELRSAIEEGRRRPPLEIRTVPR
jgi:very-short-patch-repair endonuclease